MRKTNRPTRCNLNQPPYEYAVEVKNRFKELKLVNSVPEELQTEVHNTVQKAVNKTIPKKKKIKRAKWSSEEISQTAKERKEAKCKGERERYIQLNTESQRIARRDKKAFFNEQCIKLGENDRRGKTRDLSRKIGNIKRPAYINVILKNIFVVGFTTG